MLCGGHTFTVMAKLAETGPRPQLPEPLTMRLPEVAVPEKVPEIELVLPEAVNPVPEYVQI
jgi:hypothetical protein